MSRAYKYFVKVEFKKGYSDYTGIIRDVKYSGCNRSEGDTFRFFKSLFILTAERWKKYEDGTILSSPDNTLTNQILKGILFYCGITNEFPKIKNISIERNSGCSNSYQYKECKEVNNPFNSDMRKSLTFSPEALKVLFESSLKASAIRIALSYWLKALEAESSYLKFDLLWRAFGRLYLHIVDRTSDKNGQIKMRKLLIDHSRNFENSIKIVKSIDKDFLKSFHWRKLIIHDHSKGKIKGLYEFIKRYSDSRIMHALNDVISVKKSQLSSYSKDDKQKVVEDLWNGEKGIKEYLNKNLDNQTNDIELVTILGIKYAYYLRNRYFHGEIPENAFRLKPTGEDRERELINELLTTLVYELILNHNLLRKDKDGGEQKP